MTVCEISETLLVGSKATGTQRSGRAGSPKFRPAISIFQGQAERPKNLTVPIEFLIPCDSMPLEGPDQLHLRAAAGYRELEIFWKPSAELEKIDPLCRHLPEVLAARLAVYHGLKKWDLLAVVAKRLAEWNPEELGFFVEVAYATRRADSIRAVQRHSDASRQPASRRCDDSIQSGLLQGADGKPRSSESVP